MHNVTVRFIYVVHKRNLRFLKNMDRVDFLKKCQRCAVTSEGTVHYQGIECRPIALKIWFTNKGDTVNSAILTDSRGFYIECRLEEVEEIHE